MSTSTYTIPVAPFSDDAIVPSTSTGIIVPKLATYVMRIDGVVTAMPNTSNPCSDAVAGLQPLTFGQGYITDALLPGSAFFVSPTRWASDTIEGGAETEIFVSRGGYGAAVGCNAPDGSRIGGPLYTLSSSQTLTVEVLKIGTFKLSVTPKLTSPVPKDTTVTFIEGNDGDTQDSFRKDSWMWAPADGSPPVELWPNVCGFTCRITLTQSGTMTLSGTVGGFLDGHRERVSASATVTVAGDANIALAVDKDTVSQGDTILVTTTITGADASIVGYTVGTILASRMPASPRAQRSRSKVEKQTSSTRLTPLEGTLRTLGATSVPPCLATTTATECFVVASAVGKTSIQVNAVAGGKPLTASKSVTVVASPKLVVACTAAQRGVDVICTARVTTGDPATDPPFVVLRRTAKGKRFKVEELPNASVGAGQPHVWKGPAVAKTEVEFEVRFDDRGKTKTDRKKTSFDPSTRGWQEFKLVKPGQLKKELGPGLIDDLSNGVFGLFDFEDPSFTPALATTALDGPNKNLSYFKDPIPFLDVSVSYVHPGLYGGINKIGVAWYNDQNGKGAGTCKAPAIATLQGKAEVHEGATAAPLSHWQITNDALAAAKLQQEFEAMYVQDSPGALAQQGDKTYFAWKAGDYTTRQQKFDSTDRPKIFNSLGCTIDYIPSDNK